MAHESIQCDPDGGADHMNGRWTGRMVRPTLPGTFMNFLGHLYLSGKDPDVIVGNFIGDAVKGRDLGRFAPSVQQGIRLHRAIDHLTDTHPMAALGRTRLYASVGKYAGVVLDLFYDHLLAAHWHRFHSEPLAVFTQDMYTLLLDRTQELEGRAGRMLPFLAEHDRLSAYATLDGIGGTLAGISTRALHGERMRGSEVVLRAHYDAYRDEFFALLPDVERMTAAYR